MDLTHTLAPDERLPGTTLDEQLIRVTDGVIYVALADDDVVLLPGDSLAIPAGEPRRVWNAGDVTARLLVAATIPLAAAA
jgi:quercetin dioxygenase-like cupin family protein